MNPPSPHTVPTPAALKAASRWQVRHEAGLTPAEQADFTTWHAASPDHALAWRQVAATARMLGQLNRDDTTVADLLLELARRRRRRTWKVVTGTGLGLALAAAAMFLVVLRVPAPTPGVARVESVVPPAQAIETAQAPTNASDLLIRADRRILADGSRIELNAGARLTVRYTATIREVTLLSGDALFTVAKNPDRPFIVRAGGVEVRAVGTAFAVQHASRGIDVLVTEGSVAVTPVATAGDPQAAKATPAAAVLVGAGNVLALPPTTTPDARPSPQALSTDVIRQRLAWARPRLQLANTPLADAVAALNRENTRQIVIDDPVLARLRLTGSFMADDAEGFARLLEANYEVEIEARNDGVLRLRAR